MREGRGSQFDPEVLDATLHINEPGQPKRPTDLKVRTSALKPDSCCPDIW